MAWLEFYALLVGVEMWSDHLATRGVHVLCDCEPEVFIVNNQTSKNPRCMALIRRLVKIQLHKNFKVKAVYIKSKDNCVADALSQFQEDRFKDLRPLASRIPSTPPRSLWLVSKDTWNSF